MTDLGFELPYLLVVYPCSVILLDHPESNMKRCQMVSLKTAQNPGRSGMRPRSPHFQHHRLASYTLPLKTYSSGLTLISFFNWTWRSRGVTRLDYWSVSLYFMSSSPVAGKTKQQVRRIVRSAPSRWQFGLWSLHSCRSCPSGFPLVWCEFVRCPRWCVHSAPLLWL